MCFYHWRMDLMEDWNEKPQPCRWTMMNIAGSFQTPAPIPLFLDGQYGDPEVGRGCNGDMLESRRYSVTLCNIESHQFWKSINHRTQWTMSSIAKCQIDIGWHRPMWRSIHCITSASWIPTWRIGIGSSKMGVPSGVKHGVLEAMDHRNQSFFEL